MDDEAAASAMGFVVAGVFFLGVVAVLFNFVIANIPPKDAADQVEAGHGLQAKSLLNRFVRAAGTMGYNGDWITTTGVPGLGAGGSIDLDKLLDLADGTGAAMSGELDYATARAALGLVGTGYDFRLSAHLSVDGQACAGSPHTFGPTLPVNAAVEPAQATFALAGGCDGNVPGETLVVEITLAVFRGAS